jgi:uncharacterized protein YggE
MFNRRIVQAAIASLLLIGAVPASAQLEGQRLPLTASGTVAAVTVSGRGSVHVPADRLRFVIHIFSRNQGVELDNAGKTIAETLRAHGVPNATWILPLSGSYGNGNAPVIVGTILKPTREGAETIVRETLKALPDSLSTVVQNPQVQTALFVDDCSSAQDRARQAALMDARRRAESIARAADIHLGPVVGVTETALPTTACLPEADVNSFGQGNVQDAFGPLDVQIAVTETVSFAIR